MRTKAEKQQRLIEIMRCDKLVMKDGAENYRLVYAMRRAMDLGFIETCDRCGGGGKYSYNRMYGSTCFKCDGHGKYLPRLTKKLFAEMEAAVEEGKLDALLEHRAKKQRAEKRVKTADRLLRDALNAEIAEAYSKGGYNVNPVIKLLRTQEIEMERKARDIISKLEKQIRNEDGDLLVVSEFLLHVAFEASKDINYLNAHFANMFK